MSRDALELLIAHVELLASRHDASDVVARLEVEQGARHRFQNGTYELRMAGAVGTCTAGGRGLVDAWLRAARRKLARDAEAR